MFNSISETSLNDRRLAPPQDSGNRGQATVELIVSATLVALTVALGGFILKAEWERTQCARWVFEVTRKKLEGSEAPSPPPWIHIELREDPSLWRAEGRCGRAKESIQLQKLENDPSDSEQ